MPHDSQDPLETPLAEARQQEAEAMSRLVEQLRRADHALQQSRDELDQRVQQRTLEIAESNEELKREITERRQAEEALRENEQKYRTLIETTDTGYVIVDEAGQVLDANAEYVRLTGYDLLQQIIGKNVTEWTSPKDQARNAEEVRKFMERGFVRNLEINYLTPAGRLTPIEINATVLHGQRLTHRHPVSRYHRAQAGRGGALGNGTATTAGPEARKRRHAGWGHRP
jgi:PAS domain S-box-containing protein